MKKIKTLLFICLITGCSSLLAQVAISIDGSTPDNSAMLDVKSTVKGFLVPRMTEAEMLAIPGPATGLMVYNSTSQAFYNYNGSAWVKLAAGSANILKDADGDTKIEAEQNPDEDIIRFSLAGAEKMVLKSNRLEFSDPSGNIFIGSYAGLMNTTGSANTALGFFSLANNVSGQNNTGLGYYTLLANSDGSDNIAIGHSALLSSTSSSNIGIGSYVLYSNTTGYSNIAMGTGSLYSNTTRSNLVAIGDSALYFNGVDATQWYHAIGNTAVGSKSLYSNTTGYYNTAFGEDALYANSTGHYNAATGLSALTANTTGNYNTANGATALKANTTGSSNTAIGFDALYLNTAGSFNNATGLEALHFNTTGNSNTANGTYALYYNTTGYSNTAMGTRSLFRNTISSNLVAIGDSALYYNGVGATFSYHASGNTAVGSKALYSNTTGYYNTATGSQALFSNTSGNDNAAFGRRALYSNTTGAANTANGYSALYTNTIGGYNTATGYDALYSNTTGIENTAIGVYASYYTDSDGNTSVGFSAGDYETYSYGTFLGGYAYPFASGYTNCMALGGGSRVNASNKVVIGNTSVTSIGGYAGWTDFSDQRYKTAIQENVKGLEFIMKLRPVTYQIDINKLAADLNEDKRRDTNGNIIMGSPSSMAVESRNEKSKVIYSGFLAQEVERAAREAGFDFNGVDVPKNENDFYGLRYAEFVVPLVKAVQELSSDNDKQQIVIDELKKKVEAMESQLELLLNR